ncbi:MAG: ABC transporter ATP-binding protein [Chloroflexi bacterium]|nr:ABC transporter ATP-binding protein [Chloroflexota bacterium]
MSSVVISASGLTKSFGKVNAIKGIDLSIGRGEVFGLLGPDGAGKSTLLRLLGGLLTPDAGSARIFGLEVVKDKDPVTPRIGYVSEGFPLYRNLSVKENMDFFASLRRLPEREAEARQKELLQFSRLEPYRDRLAEHLSGGMKKKLALCCALIHSPEVVFLDEPTTGIDPLSRKELWTILLRFRDRGVAICLSTPYMDEAEKCDRLALLYEGAVIGLGSPDQLKKRIPGESLELSTSSPWKGLEIAAGVPGVVHSQVFGNSVRLTVDRVDSRLPDVEAAMARNGLTIKTWKKTAFTVEDAFIQLISPGNGHSKTYAFSAPPVSMPGPATAGDPPAVEVVGLTRKFASFVAVDGISLKIRRGEIFGFLGPNGAGKSTTIRMLCGILLPSSGSGHVLGYDLAAGAEMLKPKTGYMSQHFSLYKDLTVEENIDFYAGLYGVDPDQRHARKEWVLKMSGLSTEKRRLAGHLAGGWKQRLALMRAFIHGPRIVFLDEPTSGMDPVSRRECWSFLNKMSAMGVTICVSTHYMDEAEYCHNLALLYHGKLAALGTPAELKQGVPLELRKGIHGEATMEEVFVHLVSSPLVGED